MQGIFGRNLLEPSARTQPRLQLLASACLVVLIAQGAAQLTWSLWPTRHEAAPPLAAAGAAAGGASGGSRDLAQVASLHLFGQQASEPAQKSKAPIDAPETQLNLTLTGILYSEDPDAARAIISSPRSPEQFYRVGQQVPGGATLDAVYKDRVILLRNGRHETLKLPEERLGKAMENFASHETPSRASAAGRGGQDMGSLDDYRKELVKNPARLQEYFQGRPEMRNGQMVGFRIEPGSNPQLFQMTGLQAGDIVTAVGDVQVDSPDKGIQVFQQIAKSDHVTLTVMRNGTQTQIPINFNQ